MEFTPTIIKAVTLILSATPISLLITLQIRKVFSAHTPDLAKTTTICTELKGTLTKNVLIPKKLILDKDTITFKHKSNLLEIEDADTQENIKVEKSYLRNNQLAELAAIATNLCKYSKVKNIEDILEKFFLECGFNKIKIHNDYKQIQEIPTNNKKKITTIVAIKNDTKENFAFTKGHPLSVLERCSRIMLNGKKTDITPSLKKKIKKQIKHLNQDGHKVIAFAYKGLPLKRLDHYTSSFTENDLIFIGMIGISSPLNFDLKESIDLAKQSDIKIYITTNERERTAVAAAKNLEIINPNYFEAITSSDLEQINDKKLEKLLANKEKDYVFCQLKPADRIRIMKTLRSQGETIALVNSEHGNGFKAIIQGIKRERSNNINSKKYFYHALSFKLATFLLILTAIIIKAPLPLSIPVILILDIFINFILEFALQKDTLEKDVMRKSFKFSKSPLKKSRIIYHGLIMYFITGFVYLFSLMRYGWSFSEGISLNSMIIIKSATILFILLGIMQILNAFNIRHSIKTIFRKDIFSNHYLVLSSIIVLLILYISIGFPLIQEKLNLTTLSHIEWQIILFSSLGIILFEEIRKTIIYKKKDEDSQ